MVQRTQAGAGHMVEAPPGSSCGPRVRWAGFENRAPFCVPTAPQRFSLPDGRGV